MPGDLDDTPLTMVDTNEKLQKMCSDLEKQTEFAVDLEVTQQENKYWHTGGNNSLTLWQ